MIQIALEDVATIFASELMKQIKVGNIDCYMITKNFLKMNYTRRRAIVEKVLTKMETEYNEKHN